jgi:RP/EB family microtubule-associated protein
MSEIKVPVEGVEKDRNFYFNKLRNIEILTRARLEAAKNREAEVGKERKNILVQMQQILYLTKKGCKVPKGEDREVGVADDRLALKDKEETFVSGQARIGMVDWGRLN